MKNEIKQQIFEKMKAKDFGESMCNETKLNVLKWTMQQLCLHSVSNCIAIEYAEFCVRCDREKLPLLCLEDYIKRYSF